MKLAWNCIFFGWGVFFLVRFFCFKKITYTQNALKNELESFGWRRGSSSAWLVLVLEKAFEEDLVLVVLAVVLALCWRVVPLAEDTVLTVLPRVPPLAVPNAPWPGSGFLAKPSSPLPPYRSSRSSSMGAKQPNLLVLFFSAWKCVQGILVWLGGTQTHTREYIFCYFCVGIMRYQREENMRKNKC